MPLPSAYSLKNKLHAAAAPSSDAGPLPLHSSLWTMDAMPVLAGVSSHIQPASAKRAVSFGMVKVSTGLIVSRTMMVWLIVSVWLLSQSSVAVTE